MRRTALLIGAQTFGLTGVDNDVQMMADLLVRRGFAVVLRQGPEASRAGILDGLERLIRDAHQEDVVVVYYSGHGGTVSPPRTLGAGRRTQAPRLQFIVPTDYGGPTTPDFRGITAPELSVMLTRLTKATPNVTVILDTCHSAHMMRDADLRPKALLRPSYLDVAEHLSRLRREGLDPVARHVLGNQDAVRIVACGRAESAYEYTNSAGHRIGILTESMALAMAEAGGEPVTWAALADTVRRRVRALVPSQRPEAEGPAQRLLFQTVVAWPADPVGASRPDGDALGANVAIEWGRVVQGQRHPLPMTGSAVYAGEPVYVRLRNDGDVTVHVSLTYEDDVSRHRFVVTSLDPSGIALAPGEDHTVGADEFDGRLKGFALSWPPGVDRAGALPAMINVLVSSGPQDFSMLLRYGRRADAVPESDGEVVRACAEPTRGRYRDLAVSAEPAARWDVRRISFRLDPRHEFFQGEVAMGDIVHGDKYGGHHIEGDQINTYFGGGSARPEPRKVILLMSANSDREQQLSLDEERRAIANAVAYAQAGDRLEVRTADAIRLGELQPALLSHRPAIAHFSGHGATEGIVVLDDFGYAQPVPPGALSGLFAILHKGLRCVVLNACYTEEQALAIAVHVPCVVGMRSRVLDDAAIRFAAGFYQGIAYGRSIRESFELGRNLWEMYGYAGSEAPRLMAAKGYADRRIVSPRP